MKPHQIMLLSVVLVVITSFFNGCGNAAENPVDAPQTVQANDTPNASNLPSPEPAIDKPETADGFKEGLRKGMGSILLYTAVANGDKASAEAELKKGADINWKSTLEGNTSLHAAVTEEQTELLKFLLEKGADASIKNNDGKTPLALAKETGNEAAIKILKETH